MTTIRIKSDRVGENPNMPEFRGDHWRVTLFYAERQYSLFYSKGYGHKGAKPTAEEVAECLFLDASYADHNIDEFAADLGYTKPSQAITAHKACQSIKANLERLLGDDYNSLAETA